MEIDFRNAKELISLCDKYNFSISEIMKIRECHLSSTTLDTIYDKMDNVFKIMYEASHLPITTPKKSMGGLIGGEAKLIYEHRINKKNICGNVLSRAITYAMATMEINASMGLIVAAPTAGSSGIVPGIIISLMEENDIEYEKVINSLFNAAAIGYIAMHNATIAGAVAGCQAEVGVASAMAASAAVELMGGSNIECLYAATTSIINLLGLICDPVGGLVECPCQIRNVSGVSVAISSAELALSGVKQPILLDDALDIMYDVGRRMPIDFKETATGGCATAPSICKILNK